MAICRQGSGNPTKLTTDLQRLAAHEWSGNLGPEYIWVPKLSHYTSCRKRRGKRREKKNGRGKGGVKGRGKERAREAGLLCLSAHSVRRKTKRRVKGPWDEIIPGNLERNFLNHRLGSRPLWQAWLSGVPQGQLLLLLPHYRWQQSAWPVTRGS